MKLLVLIFGTIVLILGTALADNPKQSQWTPPLVFNGGINIMSDKGQLEANQLLDANNFVWRDNQLKVREGFKRYVEPKTGVGTRFIDIFGKTSGESYLFYSDGERVWYSQGLTSAPVEIPMGVLNLGTVDTYGTEVRGNNPTTQKWLTSLGSGEGLTITINSVDYVISKIITDTSMILTTTAGNQSAQNYSISNTGIGGINSFQLSDKYWLYSSTGRLSFVDPENYTVEDTVSSSRFLSTSMTRECASAGYPSLKFNAATGHGFSGGKFLRVVLNPKSDTGASVNPLPAGHHYYTTFPTFAANANNVWTYNSAFPPDDTTDNYISEISLTPDTTTKEEIILDSVTYHAVGGLSCTGEDSSRYLKLYKSTWTDTAMFITGDWFVSPMTQEVTLGSSFKSARIHTKDTIRLTRIYMPDGEAGKVYRIGVQFNTAGATSTGMAKCAIYDQDTVLVDTTTTRAFSSVLGDTVVYFDFAEPTGVDCGQYYWLAVWSNSTSLQISKKLVGGAQFANHVKVYDGSFPASLTPGADGSTYQYPIIADVRYYISTAGLLSSYNNCLPVIGGYLDTANNFIYVGVANESQPLPAKAAARMADSDTTKFMFFRMKRPVSHSHISGYRFVEIFQDRAFTARDTTCNQIEWSEPFLPDSAMATSVMIINTGDGECITGAMTQFSDLIVYQPSSRWKVFGDGTNAGYGKEKMQGSVGCVARGSLLNIDGNHYFLHSSGFYTSDGGVPVIISANVNSYFTDSINTGEYEMVASGYDQERGNIWISFPRVGSLTNDITLVYNILTQSWWREGINIGAYYFNPDFLISDSVRFMIGKTDSSTILFRSGATDDGVGIDAYVQTGYMDFGQPENYKRIEKFHLRHDISYSDSIVYQIYADTTTSAISSTSYIPRRYSWTDRKVGLSDATFVGERLSSKWLLYNAGMATLPFISLKVWVGNESEGSAADDTRLIGIASERLGEPME